MTKKEIKDKRGWNYKVFDIGNREQQYKFHCKPIHWKSKVGEGKNKDIEEWEDIDCKIKMSGNSYITEGNKFKLKVKKNRSINETFDINRDSNHGFNKIISKVKLNNANISLNKKINGITLIDDYHLDIKVSDDTSIWIKSHESYNQWAIKTSKLLYDFEIIEKINLNGFKVLNSYTLLPNGDKKYEPDEYNNFEFQSNNDKDDKVRIKRPRMWSEFGNGSNEIIHQLYESHGELYYKKGPTSIGKDWLLNNNPTFYIDGTYYWVGDSGADDDSLNSTSATSWANARNGTDSVSFYDQDAAFQVCAESEYTDFMGALWWIGRGFIGFDTSAIGSEDTVTAATIAIYGKSSAVAGWNLDEVAYIVSGGQGETIAADSTDWTSFGSSWGSIDPWVYNDYNTFELASPADKVVKEGTTCIMVLETHDYNNTDVEQQGGITYKVGCNYSEEPDTDKDPYIEVTVTEGSSYTDSGFRVWDGSNYIVVGTPTSPTADDKLMIWDGSKYVRVGLVDPGDSDASSIYLWNGTQYKCLAKV